MKKTLKVSVLLLILCAMCTSFLYAQKVGHSGLPNTWHDWCHQSPLLYDALWPHHAPCYLCRSPRHILQQRTRRTDHKNSSYLIVHNNQIFGAIFARRNFFQKKYTHAGGLVNTALPACYIYHFTLQILKPSAQNPFRAEDFCSIIIEVRL